MLILIIGGAGSGKSDYAEQLVCRLPGPWLYIATMTAADEESRRRVARHRAARSGRGFETLECPSGLAQAAVPAGANALLEDLSNLLANEMFSPEGGGAEAVRDGLNALSARCACLTVVTNEIFSDGMRPEGELLDYMKNLAGLNRELAAQADLAVELVCGLPNILKGSLPC